MRQPEFVDLITLFGDWGLVNGHWGFGDARRCNTHLVNFFWLINPRPAFTKKHAVPITRNINPTTEVGLVKELLNRISPFNRGMEDVDSSLKI